MNVLTRVLWACLITAQTLLLFWPTFVIAFCALLASFGISAIYVRRNW